MATPCLRSDVFLGSRDKFCEGPRSVFRRFGSRKQLKNADAPQSTLSHTLGGALYPMIANVKSLPDSATGSAPTSGCLSDSNPASPQLRFDGKRASPNAKVCAQPARGPVPAGEEKPFRELTGALARGAHSPLKRPASQQANNNILAPQGEQPSQFGRRRGSFNIPAVAVSNALKATASFSEVLVDGDKLFKRRQASAKANRSADLTKLMHSEYARPVNPANVACDGATVQQLRESQRFRCTAQAAIVVVQRSQSQPVRGGVRVNNRGKVEKTLDNCWSNPKQTYDPNYRLVAPWQQA